MPSTGHTNVDLYYAIEQGNTASVQALLAKGTDINTKDEDGWSALMIAIVEGQTDIVKILFAVLR